MVSGLLDPVIAHHIELHPVLGWRYAPINQMNALALRSTREYSPIPPPSVVQIAAFGDSFVYGNEVDNANAWPTLMDAQNCSSTRSIERDSERRGLEMDEFADAVRLQ
jgi:hypothetical protein